MLTQYILDVVVDGVQQTLSLDKMPSSVVLKLRRLETATTETLIAEKTVL